MQVRGDKEIVKKKSFFNIGKCSVHHQYIQFICDSCQSDVFCCPHCQTNHHHHHQISTQQYIKRISKLFSNKHKNYQNSSYFQQYCRDLSNKRKQIVQIIQNLKAFLDDFLLQGEVYEYCTYYHKQPKQIEEQLKACDLSPKFLQQMYKIGKKLSELNFNEQTITKLRSMKANIEKQVQALKKGSYYFTGKIYDINQQFRLSNIKSKIQVQVLPKVDIKENDHVFNIQNEDLIDEAIIKRFQESLWENKNYTELRLKNNALKNEGLNAIIEKGRDSLESLQILDISDNSLEEDISLQILMVSEFKNLKEVILGKNYENYTPQMFQQFKKAYPKVSIILKQ